jgi:hypothetical protein
VRRYVQRRRVELGQARRETFVPQVYERGAEVQVSAYHLAHETPLNYGFVLYSASGFVQDKRGR